ncbi:MAG: glycosyl transferase family 2 [Flammeovirgaceae bacterium]|nr:glycosyl transferase family 2 [Flammeovirgaceae bacterium]|tara:strand:+ start:23 stop:1918 length:1896 start_codon:yes stop_codon:yes gene_type:complete
MLNVHNLSISFQGDDLFKNISYRIGSKDRIGLIGKNGAGKSTMLKILSNEMEGDTGEIATDKDLKIGFLKQDIDFEEGRTVLEETYEAFIDIKIIEKKIENINDKLSNSKDTESKQYYQLMVDLQDLQDKFEIIGGYSYEGKTEKILTGLGFKSSEFNKQTTTLSGGWRMRIELAKLLLQDNDILLLDEPTNHLDIDSIIWFESFLKNYAGAVLIVSHDKMFLDNVTKRTIEISFGKIYDYKKPYSEYLILREEMREQQLATQKNQEKEIQNTEKLINKFRAKASKASMAQSLIKKLDRMDRVQVDKEDNSVMNVHFPISVNPGKVIFEIKDLSKNYDKLEVLDSVNLILLRNSKIAFVGQNGQGKTTLAKIINSEISYNGSLKIGHNVQIGYFAQNQADYLDDNKTVLQTMEDSATEKNRSKVRDILGSFLFRGSEVDKYVKVLSGGERNRLALAKLLLLPFNVLIMDEPTNHLDIKSKNVLKEALKRFEGTLILISHDRDFLQGLSEMVYEFKDKNIKEYIGDIDYYLEKRNIGDIREIERKKEVISPKKMDKDSYKKMKKKKSLSNKIKKIETDIIELEEAIKKNNLDLEQNPSEYDEKFFEEYQLRKNTLALSISKWEDLQKQLEKL